MSVFRYAVDRSDVPLCCCVRDPFSIRRPCRFVFAAGRIGELTRLCLQIDGKDVRVIFRVGIRFVVRQKSDLVTFGAETERVIIERTRSELTRL